MKWQKVLRDAANLLRTGKWTRGAVGRDKWGHPVDVRSPNACKFCFIGAVCKVGGMPQWGDITTKFYAKYNTYPVGWNDSVAKNKEEVIQRMEELANG
jgi:hypothetical protein